MQIASIYEAKTNLSDLIKKAQEGEDIIICKAARPAVKLVNIELHHLPVELELGKGKLKLLKILINYHKIYYQALRKN
ncbi:MULTISPECIES: type II toxin-antitoxin system Phd/YefM family antitoxin [unclassified Candidatus Tisiphia]|uniref:type II toxin-antitoxin system Phd/YefM family antitoxin n=1 Tax=unclassified Candidatus Tisiphia TaxID=2996318 RepID=UPI00312CA528